MAEPEDVELFLRTNVLGLISDVLEAFDLRLAELRAGTRLAALSPLEMKLFALMRGRQRSTFDLTRATAASPSAVMQAARGLARSGIVQLQKIPDVPGDRLLILTDAGEALRLHGAEHVWKVERDMARILGRPGLEELRLQLSRLNRGGFSPLPGPPRNRRRKDH